MLFVWIILIKGRLTNQFFPEKRPVDVSSRPPLPLPRNVVSSLKSLKINFLTKIGHIGVLSHDMGLIF